MINNLIGTDQKACWIIRANDLDQGLLF